MRERGYTRADGLVCDTAVLTEGEFSVRVGAWSYYISHDKCGVSAFTLNSALKPSNTGPCRTETCKGAQYPETMVGFIKLLQWKEEYDYAATE